MYLYKNIEGSRDQMEQLDDIFNIMLDVHKEYKVLETNERLINGLMNLTITSALSNRGSIVG